MFSNQPIHTSSTQDCGVASRARSGGAAFGLRRLGAGTAAVLLMSGLAVGTGLPAQAAVPAQGPSRELVVAMEQALDAARSAVADSTASGAKKAGLNWSWADGAAVSPQEIKSGELPDSEYVVKVNKEQGMMSSLSGVTEDGLGFGTANFDEYDWSVHTNSGPKKLAKGLPRLGEAMRDGNTIYFVADSGQVFRINEPGKNKQATKLVKIPKNARMEVIGNGRVYWEKEISVGKGLTSYEVRSTSLKGGESRLEARNVSGVQITDQGVLAASVKPYKIPSGERRYTGIVKLSGGKAKPFLSLSGSAAKKGYTTEAIVPFTASGHSLALPEDAGKGTTVLNLRSRQAWTVNYPKGTESSWLSASGGRVVWNTGKQQPDNGWKESRRVYVADLDQGSVRTVLAPMGATQAQVNGSTIAWVYGKSGLGSRANVQSITLNR